MGVLFEFDVIFTCSGPTFFSKKAVVSSIFFAEPPRETACPQGIECEVRNEATCRRLCNRVSLALPDHLPVFALPDHLPVSYSPPSLDCLLVFPIT